MLYYGYRCMYICETQYTDITSWQCVEHCENGLFYDDYGIKRCLEPYYQSCYDMEDETYENKLDDNLIECMLVKCPVYT